MKAAIENVAMAMVGMFLAWAIPGAGHMLLGRWIRGVVIFVTVGALFWGGVLVGGVLTVDQHNARWWLAAQMLTGMHGLTGFHMQREVYHDLGELPDDPIELDALLVKKGIALNDNPGDNIARAYTGIAGMLNLLCVSDVLLLGLMGVRGERRDAGVSRSMGVPPVSRMGVSPMQTESGGETSISQSDASETAMPRPEHGQDAHATGDEGETPAPREGDAP